MYWRMSGGPSSFSITVETGTHVNTHVHCSYYCLSDYDVVYMEQDFNIKSAGVPLFPQIA